MDPTVKEKDLTPRPVIYPEGLNRNQGIVMGILVLLINLLVYTALAGKRS